MAGFFSVKNFDLYQHYKDRDPPWIKLHFALLNDYEFGVLSDAAKAHLLQIGLLASRSKNKIPFDPEWVGRRINATCPVDLDAFVAAGWIIVADDAASALAGKREAWPTRHIPEAIKKSVHERDGGKCQMCGATEPLEYDHIIPVSKGGKGAEDNLQLLCVTCNRKKRSNLLRSPTQPRSLETETETETQEKRQRQKVPLPDGKERKVKPRSQIGAFAPDQKEALEHWHSIGRSDIDSAEQANQFQDHHKARASTMADWNAAWRTWYRNAPRMNRQGKSNGRSNTDRPTPHDNFIEGARRLREDMRTERSR